MALQPIETNLFDFFTGLDVTFLDLHDEDDVCWFTSDVPHPLFSGALKARFAADDAVRRTHEVLDELLGNGSPFLWWLTPNTRSDALEQVLVERGLVAGPPNNAMALDLRSDADLAEAPPERVTLEPGTPANLDEIALAMLDGFGEPHVLLDPFREMYLGSSNGVVVDHVLARLDGAPVGAGSVVVSDHKVAGLYNIAVREQARGRGVGRAITIELMRIGTAHGCTESILHASPIGEPVYARLGFRAVGQVVQYLWTPEGNTP